MANRVAVKITDFLCKNHAIAVKDKDIYIYGFEIFISNVINLSIVFILGCVFNQLLHAALFYIVFVVTRSYSGGYHASTYLKCNIAFTIVFLTTIIFSKMLSPRITLVYILVFLAIYIGCILEYAPIDNENKRLTEPEKERFRKISILISISWTFITIILFFVAKSYATTLTMTLVMIAMLMLIEINKRREMYVDEG